MPRAAADGLAVFWGIKNTKATVEECAKHCLEHLPNTVDGEGAVLCNRGGPLAGKGGRGTGGSGGRGDGGRTSPHGPSRHAHQAAATLGEATTTNGSLR